MTHEEIVKCGEAFARGLQKGLEDFMKEKVKREEERIFKEKIADGTLVLFRGLESVKDISKEVLFCNVIKRHQLLESHFLYHEANFIVSDCVPYDEVYILTDEEVKKSILEERQKLCTHSQYSMP